jgi:hypothetical protein
MTAIITTSKHTGTPKCEKRLEDAVGKALPRGPGLDLLTLFVDKVPVEFATAGIDVHLGRPEPACALPEVTSDPERTDHEKGEVGLEELVGGTDTVDVER